MKKEPKMEPMSAAELLADGVLSVREAAKFLKLSRSKLYLLMGEGKLPFVLIDKSRRVPRRGLVRLLEAALVVMPPEET